MVSSCPDARGGGEFLRRPLIAKIRDELGTGLLFDPWSPSARDQGHPICMRRKEKLKARFLVWEPGLFADDLKCSAGRAGSLIFSRRCRWRRRRGRRGRSSWCGRTGRGAGRRARRCVRRSSRAGPGIDWRAGGGAVAVEEGEGGGEGRGGHAELDGGGDGLAPGGLVLVDGAGEELVEEQIVELLLLVEGGLDVGRGRRCG
jgi:hypothetical protein